MQAKINEKRDLMATTEMKKLTKPEYSALLNKQIKRILAILDNLEQKRDYFKFSPNALDPEILNTKAAMDINELYVEFLPQVEPQ